MRFRCAAGSTSGEGSATRKRPRKQSARPDLGYFIPKPKCRPHGGDVSMPDGIMVASACLPACCAALSPGQKPAIIHCPLRRTVVASRVYWWFPSGVMGLASARHRSVDSRRRRSGRFLMDIVGCLPLRWCIIVDDLAEANASTRYLAPPRVLITAQFSWDFKESVISNRIMLPFSNDRSLRRDKVPKESIRTRA